MMTLNIPFQGFYNSVHGATINDAEDMLFTDHDTGTTTNAGLQLHFYNKCDYKKVFTKYAKSYVESFKDDFNIPSLEFIRMDSPREYNFYTDKIECNISRADIRKIYNNADKVKLSEFIVEHCTSRSGFYSFYIPNLKSWGYVDNWEHAQLSLLVQFYFETHDNFNDDWEYNTMQNYESNGFITDYLENACPIIQRLYKIHDYLQVREERGT